MAGGRGSGFDRAGSTSESSTIARWLGVLRLSRRQLQQRWLESVLIILGIALGVGVLTAGETFVRFQERMTTQFLAEQMREWQAITVRPSSSGAGDALFGGDGLPAVRVSLQDLEEPVRFTMADLLAMRADVPGVKYVTVEAGSMAMDIVSADDVDLEPVFYELLPGPAGEDQLTRPIFPMLQVNMVTADEFGALGYQFVAGGPFTWNDFDEANRRVVSNYAIRRRSGSRAWKGWLR